MCEEIIDEDSAESIQEAKIKDNKETYEGTHVDASKDVSNIAGVTDQDNVTAGKDVTIDVNDNNENILEVDKTTVVSDHSRGHLIVKLNRR